MLPVLIDFDGVIADLHTEWLLRYNQQWGDKLELEDITEWDITKFVKPGAEEAMWAILGHRNLYDWIEPIRGALEGLRELTDMGVTWKIATSCVFNTMIEGKARWLRRHKVVSSKHDFPGDQLLIVKDKSLLCGFALIDDYHGNLRGFGGHRILFDAPYNRNIRDPGLIRVRSWGEVLHTIRILGGLHHAATLAG